MTSRSLPPILLISEIRIITFRLLAHVPFFVAVRCRCHSGPHKVIGITESTDLNEYVSKRVSKQASKRTTMLIPCNNFSTVPWIGQKLGSDGDADSK